MYAIPRKPVTVPKTFEKRPPETQEQTIQQVEESPSGTGWQYAIHELVHPAVLRSVEIENSNVNYAESAFIIVTPTNNTNPQSCGLTSGWCCDHRALHWNGALPILTTRKVAAYVYHIEDITHKMKVIYSMAFP